jgi:hypothetical protein
MIPNWNNKQKEGGTLLLAQQKDFYLQCIYYNISTLIKVKGEQIFVLILTDVMIFFYYVVFRILFVNLLIVLNLYSALLL